MILGILSDTHGQAQRTAVAIRALQAVGAERFVHCGDVGGVDVLEALAGLDVAIACGNVDCPDSRLVDYAATLGLSVGRPPPIRLEIEGRSIGVFHGHEPAFRRLVDGLVETGLAPADLEPFQYVLHGHTHVANYERLGSTWFLNPGALHRAPFYSVATLDLKDGRARFWQIFDDADRAAVEFDPS